MILSTKLAQPQLSLHTGKWCAQFENFITTGDETFMSSSCTSGAVFDTAADAEEGGKRALALLEETGKFPNMCEKF
jgi:hypothetical protein